MDVFPSGGPGENKHVPTVILEKSLDSLCWLLPSRKLCPCGSRNIRSVAAIPVRDVLKVSY